jgi:hypothetical protein
LWARSQRTKSRTSTFAHIQRGKRRVKPESARSAFGSAVPPRTKRSTRSASGQSPSIATPVKPFSAMSRCVIRARSR